MKIIYGDVAKHFHGVKPSDSFSVTINNEISYLGSGLASPQTIDDSIYSVIPGLNSITNKRITVIPSQADFISGIERESEFELLTPNIATLSNGLVTVIGSGVVELTIKNGYTKRHVKEVVSSSIVIANSNNFSNFESGSLREYIKSLIDSIIFGKNGNNPLIGGVRRSDTFMGFRYPNLPETAVNQFLYANTNLVDLWQRNNYHILSGINLTGISAPRNYTLSEWQDAGAQSIGGNCCTAISSRHVYGATHWALMNSMKTYFIAADSTIVERTISSSYNIPNTDIWIGYLDSALPESIVPLKCLPTNYKDYLPISGYDFPAFVCFNSRGSFHIGRCNISNGSYYLRLPTSMYGNDTSYSYLDDWALVGQFGSGSAVFSVINNEAVLIGSLWYAGYGGISLSDNITAINAAMSALHGSSEYQLSQINLSAYTTY